MSRSNNGYCCVPLCTNWSLNDPSLSFHCFPSADRCPDDRRAWVRAIRRDIGKAFKITSNTRVCSAHFRSEDFVLSEYAGTSAEPTCNRRRLSLSANPSVFEWSQEAPPKRKAPRERQDPLPSAKRRCRRNEAVNEENEPPPVDVIQEEGHFDESPSQTQAQKDHD